MIIFTKFHEDTTKNVDFLSLANFFDCLIFISSDFILQFELIWTLTCTSGWDNHIAKEGVANHAQKEYQGIKNEAKDSENNRKSY